MKDKRSIRGVRRLLKLQSGMSLLISLMFLFFGKKEAISALLGGLLVVLPSGLFARKLFRYQGAQVAPQIVKSFYVGEALKILLSIVLFTLVFKLFKISPPAFFFTYIVVLMTHWFAPLFFVNE